METKKYTYKIVGIDCAGCAMEFEKGLNKLDYVDKATFNFANSKLIIYYDEDNLTKLKQDIHNIEDKARIAEGSVTESFNKKILISVISSLIITIFTLFVSLDKNIEIGILAIAYIIAGYDVIYKLFRNIFKLKWLDENFLMGVATVAAFAIGEYYEAIAIIIFYKVGEFFQDLAVNKSRKSIGGLMDIQAEYANLIVNGEVVKVDPRSVKVGDTLVIKNGEKIPVDCIIIEGSTYLDTSSLTGESRDVRVDVEDHILSGSINKQNVIKVRVEKAFEDSTVSKILDLIENSSANKAPTEDFITTFAKYYTPIVVLIAILIAIVPTLIFKDAVFNEWMYRGLIFLVISCPCALVISIPLGFFGGIGNASKHGILIKGANYLEALNSVETVVFDKTGTLTKGNFKVINVFCEDGVNKEELVKIAAHIESYSNHPISKSILDLYNDNIDNSLIGEIEEISGKGLIGSYDEKVVMLGNYELLIDNNVVVSKVKSFNTLVYVVVNGKYNGYIELADEIKEQSKSTIQMLKDLGVKQTIMLSGDSSNIVKSVASSLSIDKYYAQLLPHEKVEQFEVIEANKEQDDKVVFVGDGINDAPVLTRADIGIAMGGVGSDAAIESADIVIMDDDISKIPLAIRIANKTKRIVVQNIVIALAVKLFVIILGVVGVAAIWQAVIADVGVALVAIFNAMRILKYRGE